ncbi:hypothetical protein E4T56_gene4573, partial [Termitomyces sp. T112]
SGSRVNIIRDAHAILQLHEHDSLGHLLTRNLAHTNAQQLRYGSGPYFVDPVDHTFLTRSDKHDRHPILAASTDHPKVKAIRNA